MYPNDGVINHCCHCGPMSSKYRGASAFSQSDLDSEAQLMEQLHQSRIAEDNDNSDGEEEEEEEEEDKVMLESFPGIFRPMPYQVSSMTNI